MRVVMGFRYGLDQTDNLGLLCQRQYHRPTAWIPISFFIPMIFPKHTHKFFKKLASASTTKGFTPLSQHCTYWYHHFATLLFFFFFLCFLFFFSLVFFLYFFLFLFLVCSFSSLFSLSFFFSFFLFKYAQPQGAIGTLANFNHSLSHNSKSSCTEIKAFLWHGIKIKRIQTQWS